MNHNLPTDNGPEKIAMRQWAALGLVFAGIGTVISAMNHMTGWTLAGLVLVGINIFFLNLGE